ncbi:hypothetical protein IEU95_01645 [Hoyosella rhizosphaerae]|uniref:Transmembrane protein n=1 Tax=Hoyosella rhizosphaerae TaxID=1755582 RepID=A0A916XGF4_9ACTN|nr:hypothetical protein [Hoyosella rhizosphaerae]MBN4925518.1 hypothetical protein [Hoyosella rhizosphaerae]GGC69999.1 hypothetical protein GCM10011410_23560 [Hoyosella rhizosphaerae]
MTVVASRKVPTRSSRRIVLAASALVVAAMIVRIWVLNQGFFYWDDFILMGRAATHPLWSTEFLLYDHDDHFMPMTFVVAWVVTMLAPFNWFVAAASLVLLQLAAVAAVLRLLYVLLGLRWALLVPLTFYLFSPLSLPAFSWWAAGLNALPLQFALAWVSADAIRFIQTGRYRYVGSSALVFVVALLFFEKSAVVPVVAFVTATLWWVCTHNTSAVLEVARRGWAMWVALVVVTLAWLPAYSLVVSGSISGSGMANFGDFLSRTLFRGFIPALAGGPWQWERWHPSTPWADAPMLGIVGGSAVIALAVLVAVVYKRYAAIVVGFVALYVLLTLLPVVLMRSGPGTAPEIVQSLRYLADTSVVVCIAVALIIAAPWRREARHFAAIGSAMVVAFVASSMWSTVAFSHSWAQGPAKEYVSNIQAATRSGPVQILEQEVPWNLLGPVTNPHNLASVFLAPLSESVSVQGSVEELRVLTDEGEIVDGEVWWNRSIVDGPAPNCGHRIDAHSDGIIPLNGAMIEHGWTAQLNYLANMDGAVDVSFAGVPESNRPPGAIVSVPVKEGLNTVFVRIVGGGEALQVIPRTSGLDMCIGSGPVGVAVHTGG